jgi:hypothetical protein
MAKPLPPQDRDLTEALEPKHCRAICEEIGERLRFSLALDTSPVPMRLRRLVDQIAELEGAAPPVISQLQGGTISPGTPQAWAEFLVVPLKKGGATGEIGETSQAESSHPEVVAWIRQTTCESP